MIKQSILLPDLWLSVTSFLLLSLSVLIIYSSDLNLAIQQIVFGLIGIIIFYLVSLLDFRDLGALIKVSYLLVVGLLIVTLLLGLETRGSVRWIPLGLFNLQPSEIAKPVLILTLARFWLKRGPSWLNLIKSLGISLPLILLVFQQPDLGSCLVLIFIWFVSLLATNLSLVKIVIVSLTGLIALPIGDLFLKDYQRQRVLSFLDPSHDPLGTGYNVIQSMIAVGSGQLWGRGLGHGTQSRLQFLPEFRTDFIFASLSEELGFLGSLIVLGLYGLIMIRILKIASISDSFGSIVTFGVVGMIFFQTAVNIGMNAGVLPVTGITLPLLSYGGSSVISTFLSLGLVASVYRYSR